MRNNLLDVPSNRYTQGSSWNSLKEHESWPSAWTIHLKFTRSAEEGDGFLISYPDFSDCHLRWRTRRRSAHEWEGRFEGHDCGTEGQRAVYSCTEQLWRCIRKVRRSGSQDSACALDDAREGRRRVTEYAGPYVHRGRSWTQRAARISPNKPRQPRFFSPETRARSIAPALAYHQPDDCPHRPQIRRHQRWQ